MSHTFTSSIISASAGTGKTYQLATRFIALLALGEAPESMIALTFARKAAHEFRERILKDLAAGASGKKGAADLAARIRQAWHGDGHNPPLALGANEDEHPLTEAAFTDMLQRVVAAMARTRLSTLDSFFTSILSAGKSELNVGQFSQIGEEEKPAIIRKVMDNMLYDISQSEEDSAAFHDIILALAEDNTLTPHETFAGAVAAYLDDFVDNGCQTARWGNTTAFGLPEPRRPRTYSFAERQETRENLNRVYANAPHEALAAGINKLLEGKLPNKTEYTRMKKEADKLAEAGSPFAATLDRMVEETRRLALWQCAARSRGLARFLMKYFQYYTAEVTGCGKFDYSDITRRLPALLEAEGARERLDYRLDNRYRHWMLDEFQDTSEIQWRALRLLTENLASESAASPDKSSERSLFVVGDTKQSIYQWRGGKPEIFDSLLRDEPWHSALQQVDMNRSWRSAPIIMDFVNQTFRDFPRVKEHRSAAPLSNHKGFVGMYTCENGRRNATPQACEKIREILQELPIREKQMSVGILVRKNDVGEEIYRDLKQHFGETLPIYLDGQRESVVNNPLGEVLLAFFRWLAHPADSHRKAEFFTSPLGTCMQGAELHWAFWQQKTEGSGISAVLEDFKGKLATHGFVLSPYHQAVLDLCLREAISFDAEGGSLAGWISRLENLSCTTIPPKHAVHIISIHKSKGLEYDAVILPFMALPAHSAFFNPARVDRMYAPDGSILVPADKGAGALATMWPELQACLDTAEQDANAAGVNELYVALTRAAYANYIILHQTQKPANNSYGGIIKNSLPPADAARLESGSLEYGDKEWYTSADLEDRAATRGEDTPLPMLPQAARRRKRKSPSKEHGETAANAGVQGEEDSGFDAADFGTRVHALFEQIGNCAQDPLPGWATNPALAEERVVAQALQQPDILALLSPPPGAVILREQSVEAVTDSTWTSAIIDRLTLTTEGNRVAAAHIIDYKTDRRRGDTPQEQDAALRTRHQAQMEAYRDLVCRAFGLEPSRVQVTLVSCPSDGAAPRTVPCPPAA